MTLIVATEQLGWPGDESSWLERKGLLQKRARYPNRPDEPAATCHLQPSEQEPALCGHPWEVLSRVPGDPGWTELHPEMRCDRCSKIADIPEEDPVGHTYRFTWRD